MVFDFLCRQVGWLNRARIVIVSGFCLSLGSTSAGAQQAPSIKTLNHSWLTRGEETVVEITGEGLGLVEAVLVDPALGVSADLSTPDRLPIAFESSGRGLHAKGGAEAEKVTVRFGLEPDCALGEREIRLVSDDGVSNPLIFRVSPWQERPENTLKRAGSARVLEPGIAVSGTISRAAETDRFKLSMREGQRVTLDVRAFREGSRLDPSLAVMTAKQEILEKLEDVVGFDPVMEFTAPAEGDYLIAVRDYQYRGGGGFDYRMVVSEGPFVLNSFPFGGQRGTDTDVDLLGFGLSDLSPVSLVLSESAELGRQTFWIGSEGITSNAIRFEVSHLKNIFETDQNNDRQSATEVIVPAAINGRIETASDVDVFELLPASEGALQLKALTREFGSPLDAVLTLFDQEGTRLARSDDGGGSDALINYGAFKKDQRYYLEIRDLLGRGGSAYGYRITADRSKPDYQVVFHPDVPRLRLGSSVAIRCELKRAGFQGPVAIEAFDLPAGVSSSRLILGAGDPNEGFVFLTAKPDAELGLSALNLMSSHSTGSEMIVKAARPAMAGKPDTAVQAAYLTILPKAPYDLSVLSLKARGRQAASASVSFKVNRLRSWKGEVTARLRGFVSGRRRLSDDIQVSEVTLGADEQVGRFDLRIKDNSEIGQRPVYIVMEAMVDGQTVTVESMPFDLEIEQAPFTILSTLKRVSLTRLPEGSESLANKSELTIKASRRGWFSGPISLRLEGLPEGIEATVPPIESSDSEIKISLVALSTVVPQEGIKLKVVGEGRANGRNFTHQTGTIDLTVLGEPSLAVTEEKENE